MDGNYWQDKYWPRVLRKRLSRRRLMQLGALGAVGAMAAAYLGCEGEEKKATPTPAGSPPAGASPTAAAIPSPTIRRGGTMTFASPFDLSSMDPAYWSQGNDKVVIYNLYDWPMYWDLDEDRNIVYRPHLGESWEWVDDTTLIMRWRKGVKFHDGTDFNADAVQAYDERVLNPDVKSFRRPELAALDHTEKVDDYTTRYILKAPDAVIFIALTFWTSEFPSPAAVEKWGDDYASHPVGTGPFMLKSQQPGASYELEKNPNYWIQGEPYLDGYTVRIIPDKAVAAAALESGEVDFAWSLNPTDVVRFQQSDKLKVVKGGPASVRMVYINSSKEPGSNLHLRKALSLAVNREEFVQRYQGLAFITPGPMIKGGIWGNPDQPDPEYNPDKRRRSWPWLASPRASPSTSPTLPIPSSRRTWSSWWPSGRRWA